MTQQPAVRTATKRRPAGLNGAVLRYRIMAFTTGVVLVAGCIMLILKDVLNVHHMEPATGLVWLGHGWLYLIYVIVTFMLGIKLRWSFPKFILVIAAGTIPTMSFVAEHFVMKRLREDGMVE
jgi:integral membrane protein